MPCCSPRPSRPCRNRRRRSPPCSLPTTTRKEALRADEQGTVGFRLAIDTKGAITGCEVTQTSGYRSLDEATCALLTSRAKFRPARDSVGRAAAGTHTSRIVWRIPEQQPLDFASYPGVEAGLIVWSACIAGTTVARAPSPPSSDEAAAVLKSCANQEAALKKVWPQASALGGFEGLREQQLANIRRVFGILRAPRRAMFRLAE